MAQQRLLKLDKDGKPFTGNDVGPNGELRYYKNGRLLEGIGGAAQMLQGGFEDLVEPLVDGGKNYLNRQTRLTKEALNKYKPKSPKDEAINWFNTVIEDPSLSDQVRTPLLQAVFNMQNAFELEDTDTMTWAQSMAMQESNPDLSKNINKVNTDNKKTKVDSTNEDDTSNESEHPLSDPDYSPETTKANQLEQQAAARQERLNRRDARVEAKKLEGFHAKRFQENLKKGTLPGTKIEDLFHKAK